ncbi:MAG: hypothetical protein ACRDRH_07435 [Pseudonocardia sp.]
MTNEGRHPKKQIAEALATDARNGLEVQEIHREHRWGVLRCTVCGDHLALYSTPRVPENTAKRIHNFANAAEHLSVALVSALRNIESAGLHVTAVESEDLVSLKEIADRTGRGYESVRLLARGGRGPGGFPPPMSAAGWTLYSWATVARWFADNYGLDPEYDRILAAADLLVRARAILQGDAEAAELSKLVA